MSQTTHAQHEVTRPRRKQGLWIGAAVVAAMTAAGCAISTATETVTATPTAPATAPTSPTGTGAPTATENAVGSIPFYQPSTVRSHTGNSAVLNSPDPVTKVSDYYVKLAETGGWTIVSKSVTSHNGNLTLKKSGQGATISVAPFGSGSVITISTYPTS